MRRVRDEGDTRKRAACRSFVRSSHGSLTQFRQLSRFTVSHSVPFHINSLSFLFVVMWERNVKRIRMKNPVGAGFLSSFVRSGVLSSLCHAVPSSLRSSRMEGDVRRLTTVTYGEARDGNDQGNSRFAHPRSCVTSSPLHLFRLLTISSRDRRERPLREMRRR